ncbi:MAG: glycosyltransferase [Chloroflexota bacterium]
MTFIHDLIPLQVGPLPRRLAAWIFVRAALAVTSVVITVSQQSREHLLNTFHLSPEKVVVVDYPTDSDRADRIMTTRARYGQDARVLFVGRFASHKNLERLCVAWQTTDAIAEGAQLELIGGNPAHIRRLSKFIEHHRLRSIRLMGPCTEEEFDFALATSRALVMPSLVEGYGLPAYEAAATGLPVAVAPTGALVHLPESAAVQFNPRDLRSISRGIDTAFHRRPHAGFRIGRGGLYRGFIDALARAC